jgi:hypothetical protein
MIEKYGLLGNTGGVQEKQVEIEVIREKRVEIPVEVIKEVVKVEYVEVPVEKIVTVEKPVEKLVEVIKEVPVEVIKEVQVEKIVEVIKEVPVEKIVTIYDNSSENELFGKIEQLEQNIFHLNEQIESERKIFSTKIEEMENNFQNTDNNKLQMLQKTITNLNVEIRDLKIKNKELENKLLEQPKESDFTKARFHGSSNLNDDLYK